MNRPINYEREYFEGPPEMQATLTDQQQDLLKEVKALEQDMFNRKHDTRWTAKQNADYREQKLFEIQTRFYEANQRMHEQLQAEAEKHREDYLKRTEADTGRLLLEQRRWENRYSSMSPDQLAEEATSYALEQAPEKILAWNPDRLDTLTAAMVRSGKGSLSGELRKAMEGKRYTEPWRNERPEFYKAMALYEPKYGVATVLNSVGGIEDIPIGKIYMEKTGMEE